MKKILETLKKFNKIRNKLLALLLLVALVPILFMGGLAIKSIKNTRLKNVQELERLIITQLNERLKKTIDDKIETYRINVADPNITAIGPEQQQFILNQLLLEDASLIEASFLNKDGLEETQIARNQSDIKTDKRDFSQDDSYNTVIDGEDYVSEVFFENGKPQIIIASPVVNQSKEIINILQTKVDLSGLSDTITNSVLGESGYTYITNEAGNIIAVSGRLDKKTISSQTNNELLDEAEEEDVRAFGVTKNGLTAGKVLTAAKKIPQLNWIIAAEWPEEDAMSIINKILLNLEIFTIILILIAFALGLTSSRSLLHPIKKLKEGTDAIAKGEFETAIEIKTGDEFEDLGHAFNAMAGDLKKFNELNQEKQKRLENAFGQYVGGSMVENVLSDQEVKLGGERKYISVLFADIKNFTSISETLEPEVLVKYLNKYLTAMTDIILKHGGVIDKYIGDAILAFWGAPLTAENHAYKACLAAEEMLQELKNIQKDWSDHGLPEIDIRIGINSGGALVGNVGSTQRLSYTVIGDVVNLAARLETLNKQYSTRILVSQSTQMEIRDKAKTREIDKVEVKGKTEGVKIYELLFVAKEATPDILAMAKKYEEGLALYRIRKWGSAIAVFAEILKDFPEDGPSVALMARSQSFEHTPPPAEWDGTFHATEK